MPAEADAYWAEQVRAARGMARAMHELLGFTEMLCETPLRDEAVTDEIRREVRRLRDTFSKIDGVLNGALQ